MKGSRLFRMAVPGVVVAATLTLAGCETMNSMWDSTKSLFTSSNVTLSGASEVPPVSTSASGKGSIKVGSDRTVSGSVKTSGMSATAAHIHLGAPGKNGPVVVGLVRGADGATWSVPDNAKLTDAQYDAFRAGELYVNVHSDQYKGGEIRGQLKP